MQTATLNPTQRYLLHLFSFDYSEENKTDMQQVITGYYYDKVRKRAGELWNSLDLNQSKLDEMSSIHERLPYQ